MRGDTQWARTDRGQPRHRGRGRARARAMGRSGPPGDPLNASGEHACGQQREGARWGWPDHDEAWPASVLEPGLTHGPQPALVAKDVPRANSTTAPGGQKEGRSRSLFVPELGCLLYTSDAADDLL